MNAFTRLNQLLRLGQRGLPFVLAATVGCATLPPRERAEKLQEQAAELRQKNKLLDAHKALSEALELDPTNLTVLRGLVELSQRVGRLTELEARFKATLARSPGDAYAHEGLGLTYFALGAEQAPKAEPSLKQATLLAPEVADFHYRLGLFYVESDRYADAKAPLARAIELDPKRARYRLPYALSLARMGDRVEAVKHLETVLKLDASRDEVALAEKTSRHLIDPFRGFPPGAREQFEIALNWMESDSIQQAVSVLEGLLQKYPDLAMVHTILGLAAAKSDNASRAIFALRKAIELNPDLAEPHMYLGDIYFSRGRSDNAREHFEAAIARSPFLADAYLRLANVHLKLNEPELAAQRYRVYLLLRPTDLEATLGNAKVLTDLKKPEAQTAWDEAVKTFPRRPETLVGRGRFYFVKAATASTPEERAKAKAEAAKDLEKVVELDPENVTATSILSQLRQL